MFRSRVVKTDDRGGTHAALACRGGLSRRRDPLASAKHANKEGAVQAAVSVFSAGERVMVDREVALSFKDTSTKTRIFEEITAPYLDVVRTVAEVPGQHPTSFGGECDLLAVDARGRLLAVEVKPRNVSSIAWAGIQATIYAELFTRWLRSHVPLPQTSRKSSSATCSISEPGWGSPPPTARRFPTSPRWCPSWQFNVTHGEFSSIASDLYTGLCSTHLAAPEPTWRSTKSA